MSSVRSGNSPIAKNRPWKKAENRVNCTQMTGTRHCHNCGWEWTLAGQPGRGDSCHVCNADLRVCLNCVSYDPRVAHQCRDRRADPVLEKAAGNFCEYFELARRVFAAKGTANTREEAAREKLKKLFGD
jgi:hypothetical protein